MSGDNCYLKNNILYQQYCDTNNDDVTSEYGLCTATLSPNVKIKVHLRILMMIMKRVMAM